MTIDQELAAKLLDSSEIELFTIKPVIYENPKLDLDLPKLNTMVCMIIKLINWLASQKKMSLWDTHLHI